MNLLNNFTKEMITMEFSILTRQITGIAILVVYTAALIASTDIFKTNTHR
jgi:hypothetical protein